MKVKNGYPSEEKLKSRKALELLFSAGKSFSVFPIKIFYTLTTTDAEMPSKVLVNAGVGVSARNFKKAVDRNRIKRLLREAYRTQKQALHIIVAEKNIQVAVFFLFIGKELATQIEITHAMAKVLVKLMGKLGDGEQQSTITKS
ncbi:MAG: ribonuclease P protein component [Sphingobacteriia bacterium]|nr:MAG: ribonuclease P protein component [Sphingobacteriia bacterium]